MNPDDMWELASQRPAVTLSPDERRAEIRIESQVPLNWGAAENWDDAASGTTRDVSLFSLGLTVPDSPLECFRGQRVQIVMERKWGLPPVTARGRVLRVHGKDGAVEIGIRLDEQDYGLLSSTLSHHQATIREV